MYSLANAAELQNSKRLKGQIPKGQKVKFILKPHDHRSITKFTDYITTLAVLKLKSQFHLRIYRQHMCELKLSEKYRLFNT